MTSALTIVGESNFTSSFVSYGLVTKSLGARAHFSEGDGENKMSKNECESFYNQIRMNHLTWFSRGQNP
jgi:hypothetical protein